MEGLASVLEHDLCLLSKYLTGSVSVSEPDMHNDRTNA